MKMCTKCKQEKPLGDFGKRANSPGGVAYWCKVCWRGYMNARYANRSDVRETAKAYAKAQRVAGNLRIIEYLQSHPCVDCGEADIEVLEFDHVEMVGPRGLRISQAASGSTERLIAEIAKCEVRCANCHTRRTRKQMGWIGRVRDEERSINRL
jgi:hypothetical protein